MNAHHATKTPTRALATTALAALLGLGTGAVFADVQIDEVVRTADGEPVGESRLERHVNRVSAIVRTTDLDPGSAVTVWWRIYNRPARCATPYACELADLANPRVDGSQLHAGAVVVEDADGHATVVVTLYRTAARAQGGGPLAYSFEEGHLNGRGLRRPLDAEEAAAGQLSTPGATPIDCADAEAPTPARTFRCGVIQRVDHGAL